MKDSLMKGSSRELLLRISRMISFVLNVELERVTSRRKISVGVVKKIV